MENAIQSDRLTTGEVGKLIGARPLRLSELIASRPHLAERCPIIDGKRRIPRELVWTILEEAEQAFLRGRGRPKKGTRITPLAS